VNDDQDSWARGYHGTHTVGQNDAEADGIRTRLNDERQRAYDEQITASAGAPPVNRSVVSGGGGGGSALGVLILLGIGVAVFAILYPFTVIAAIAAAWAPSLLLRLFVGDPGRWQLLIMAVTSVILGIGMLWAASRFDHQLADQRRWYRLTRHVLRLAILAVLMFATVFTIAPSAANAPESGDYSAMAITSAVVGIGVLGAHLFLRRCNRLQESWHERLEDWGFRQPS
jgi:hypothetical protein